jgi:uncharacterized protein YeaO (DUF488 family)
MALRIERVYDSPTGKGVRFLVERLWPRGIKRETLKIDAWLKDVAPSTELRQWFSHDPAKWSAFRRRYAAELDRHPEAWRPILDAAGKDDVTLLYSAHDTEHNNAIALGEYVEAKLKASTKRRHA